MKEKYAEACLIARKATEPTDILWKNMKGDRGLFICRRLFLFSMGLALILFISTPIVIFANVKKVDHSHFFDMSWTDEVYGGQMLKHNFPPMCVIGINLLILNLIDIASLLENYETHSLYQRAVFLKSLLYLTLNMLVIPALTLSNTSVSADKKMTITTTQVDEASSLWEFMMSKNFDITKILGEIYIGENGTFFVSLVMMQATISCSYYLMNCQDIMFSYFSPWLATMKRKVFQDTEPWLRKEGNNFMYGFHYASMVAVFGICIFFSSTVPLVSLASAFYAGVKHLVDALNILTVNRKEIDSQGELIDIATNCALVFVVLYQLSMIAFFTITEK
jgi:hypothetical protein